MPRYFFDVDPSSVADSEGEELYDDAAAWRMASAVAIEITARTNPGPHQRLVVTDRDGRIVCEVRLAIAALFKMT
jgi:hypothetical protein